MGGYAETPYAEGLSDWLQSVLKKQTSKQRGVSIASTASCGKQGMAALPCRDVHSALFLDRCRRYHQGKQITVVNKRKNAVFFIGASTDIGLGPVLRRAACGEAVSNVSLPRTPAPKTHEQSKAQRSQNRPPTSNGTAMAFKLHSTQLLTMRS
jgi:hypothetical protein